MAESKDAYISYIHRFFNLWVPVYDLFGYFILPVYRKTAAAVRLDKDQKVLDVCTGTGEIAIRLARQGAAVTAIDVTPTMLEKAKKKDGTAAITFVQADARQLPFADKSFDQSVISLALHDMPRPVRIAVLQEMLRVTKKQIVISDYDFSAASVFQRAMRWMIRWFETSYYVRFSEEGVLPLIAEAKIGTPHVEKCWFCFVVVTVDVGGV